jgi:hypothetical protein
MFLFGFQTWWEFPFIGQVITTFTINTFVDAEAFPLLLGNQDVTAVRAAKLDGMLINVIGVKEFLTDLAHELTFGAIVFV